MTAEAQGAELDAEFVGVVKRFGAVTAVAGVDLAVRRGEFLSLLGPSGCGKTTALRLLAGFEQPNEGSILIGGVDAVGIPPYRRSVNTVFQHYALFPHMTVRDNVAYGLKQRGVARAERQRLAEEALDLVQLRGYAARRPRELSGGQQQRVALARALVLRPRVLLLDEPLGALDLKLRREMQIELKRMQSQLDLTFVYVTHDQEEAMSMSDRIAVMSRGRIEQLDRPQVIYDRPASAFIAGFIGDMNFLEGQIADTDETRWSAQIGPLIVHGLGDAERGAHALIGVRPENVTVAAGSAAGGVNEFAATLIAAMVLGDQVQLIAELPGGMQIVAREQRAAAGAAVEQLSAGDAVLLRWSPEAAMLLPGDAPPDGSAA
ncbi:MAG: spermidine/putrescine transport system ATP-binding protein [Gaiellales bacterium]|jgi:spermidine/putrescine transport system ATP-binding protein|nr:spermidine/putrescine transport system ATP-binding protein [Gaiellales bacterium]